MLGAGRRELRRCLCICVRVQHGASGVEIVRITLGNYHVEPQSREAQLWLVYNKDPMERNKNYSNSVISVIWTALFNTFKISSIAAGRSSGILCHLKILQYTNSNETKVYGEK